MPGEAVDKMIVCVSVLLWSADDRAGAMANVGSRAINVKQIEVAVLEMSFRTC